MVLDVTQLARAESSEIRMNGTTTIKVWYAEAHDLKISYQTLDLDAEYWVSPIFNMREKGVSLIDSSGQMVKNRRIDR